MFHVDCEILHHPLTEFSSIYSNFFSGQRVSREILHRPFTELIRKFLVFLPVFNRVKCVSATTLSNHFMCSLNLKVFGPCPSMLFFIMNHGQGL